MVKILQCDNRLEAFIIMKIFILNGESVALRLKGKHLRSRSRSRFQHKIGQQLLHQYPHDPIFEEVFIPVENLIFDFFIPAVNLVVECNGRQHSQHIKFFHHTKQQFHQQQERDRRKKELCELNGFRLIEVYDE